jgi:cytochrome c551/c552
MSAAAMTPACTRRERVDAPPAVVYEDHVWAGGVPPPGATLSNPYVEDTHSAKDGELLFASMNCDGCHGGGGSGWVGPSLADGRWRYGGEDSEIFNSIFYGRPKGMPAYGGVIGRDGAWRLVSYLKSLPRPDVVPTQSWIEPQNAEGAAGAQASVEPQVPKAAGAFAGLESLMQQYGCAACHAVDRNLVGPSFEAVAARYRKQPGAEHKLVASARSGSVGVWGTIAMPPNTAVSDEDLQRIIKQVLSLQSTN